MKIIVADDNQTFREALVLFLESELGCDVIGEHADGSDLLNDDQLTNADIVLLDIEMPTLNGFKTMEVINDEYSYLKVIAITDYFEMVYLKELINHGFKGCVFKNSIFTELNNALLKVNKEQMYFPDGITMV